MGKSLKAAVQAILFMFCLHETRDGDGLMVMYFAVETGRQRMIDYFGERDKQKRDPRKPRAVIDDFDQ